MAHPTACLLCHPKPRGQNLSEHYRPIHTRKVAADPLQGVSLRTDHPFLLCTELEGVVQRPGRRTPLPSSCGHHVNIAVFSERGVFLENCCSAFEKFLLFFDPRTHPCRTWNFAKTRYGRLTERQLHEESLLFRDLQAEAVCPIYGSLQLW